MFFFEKKNQKTFTHVRTLPASLAPFLARRPAAH
jgi:hypothetical protein